MLGIVVVSVQLLTFDDSLCCTRALGFSSSLLADPLFLCLKTLLATFRFLALALFLTFPLLHLSITLSLQLFATLFLLLLQLLLLHLLHRTRR